MNTFLELVRQRQSVRRYDPTRPVARAAIERCLEAARLAPSACNSQPWQFIVVAEPAAKNRLAAAAFGGVFATNKFAAVAPVLIVVLREKSTFTAQLGGWVRGLPYNLIDLGIACEHLVLQAAEEGLGTCWLGWFDGRAVRKALNLPRSAQPDIIIALGYAASGDVRAKNRKPPAEVWRYAPPAAK
ncbi:MAG: nitroreductase family protein [Kiritimatiellaeota bacterium]|nr:nitroreductase family protein [Kiritimatiellota bacterium]